MSILQLQGVFELGLIYAIVSLGVFLSFRVLQFPDLTVDGSFPLGAATCAALIAHGTNPLLATALACLAGAVFGWVTAFLSTSLRVLNLLAGILTMSALYSINLRIMGNRPNLSLLGEPTLFTWLRPSVSPHLPLILILLACFVTWVALIVIWFLGSETGLAVRATGCNPRMARSQGVNTDQAIKLGLSISNACVALGGALFCQVYGFADVTLGLGTIIIGLASVIIGEAVLPQRSVVQTVIGCIAGAILYRLLIGVALNLGETGLQASDLNLITAFLVVLAMSLPRIQTLKKTVIHRKKNQKR